VKGFPIHPKVEEGIQQIDAALFNGDTFDDAENRAHLKGYVERWLRRIEEDEKHAAEERAEEDTWAESSD
jgi:hypothetical protein